MAPETVDPIDWSHPPPSWSVPHELDVMHDVNEGYKSQDLLLQPELEQAYTGMPDQRTACAATQGNSFEFYNVNSFIKTSFLKIHSLQ